MANFASWAIRDRIKAALEDSLAETPLEDGFTNPAEAVIAKIVSRYPQSAPRWIREWVLGEAEPSLGRDVLLCLSRALERPIPGWALGLVEDVLGSPDLRLRYSGVRALELWAGEAAKRLLIRHRESVLWLAGYIRSVLRDLD